MGPATAACKKLVAQLISTGGAVCKGATPLVEQ